jgi:lipid II:glycine glycyltransferase (peptidoglycan interpeptide bridge formation enzyme)
MSNMVRGYDHEVDPSSESQWHNYLDLFADANIYQTWPYGAVRHGEKDVSRFVLRREGQVVALAQARLQRIPLLRAGIAYVRWGPIWMRKGKKRDVEDFRMAVRGLRNEYALKRGLALRIRPFLFSDEFAAFPSLLTDEGFTVVSDEEAGRTLVMDLSPSLDTLRAGIERKWRRHLSHAETKGFSFLEGYGDDLFEILKRIYDEMINRKKFVRPNDMNEFREIQKRLPPELKMRIILCFFSGAPAAGALCSTMGDFGMNIYRATNDIGRQTGASYLLQWRIIEWVKQQGCAHYNVNGINPERNPGTYRFKAGFCGRNGRDVHYLGQFDSYRYRYYRTFIKWGGKLRSLLRSVKTGLNRTKADRND